MASLGFVRKLTFWKKVKDLETLEGEIDNITRRVEVAIEWRKRIIKRTSKVIELLRQNPDNETARKQLVESLERERQFVDMVRNGTKNSIRILNSTRGKLKKAKMDPKLKAEMLQDLQFVVDTMRFAQGKIEVVENRIKLGEALESKGYGPEHLDEFLQTRVEEEKINEELDSVLEGKSEEVRKELSSLWHKLKDKKIRALGGLTASTLGWPVAYIHLAESGAAMPDDFTLKLFASILAASAILMVALSKDTIKSEETRRRGWVGK